MDGSLKQYWLANNTQSYIPYGTCNDIENSQNHAEIWMMITLGIRKCLVFGRGVTKVIFGAGKVPVLYVCGGYTAILTLKD